MAHDKRTQDEHPAAHFARRVLIVILIASIAAFLWTVREAILLAFASVVLALVVSELATPIQTHAGIGRGWALGIAGLSTFGVIVLLVALIGTEAFSQIRDLGERLPRAVTSIETRFGIQVVEGGADGLANAARNAAHQALSWGSTVLGAVSGVVPVAVGAAYLAASPETYRTGLIKLFPQRMHERVADTVDVAGAALSRWLVAQLLSMALVGLLVAVGAWAIGLPAPLALGLFAALTEFVPIVGPLIGAAPALLLALSQGGSALLWTLALFVAVQQLESNIVNPLLTRRIAKIPPAVLLFSVVAFGIVFGTIGVILAAPLTMLAYVAVTKLWVRETLDEPAEVPGEDHLEAKKAEQAAQAPSGR
jgi:predicted PurR-regulated permease PerM